MADEDQNDSAQTDDSELWGDTAEEAVKGLKSATENSQKATRALMLTAAHQQEAQLPKALPNGVAPTAPQPAQPMVAPPPRPQITPTIPSPVAPGAPTPAPDAGGSGYEFGRGIGVLKPPTSPAGQGRSYMGPAMNPQQEAAFMRSPQGTRIAPPNASPLAPPQQSALQSRLAAGTRPPNDPRLTEKGGDQFQAQQGYQNAVAQGMAPEAAAQLYLPAMLRGPGRSPITPQQRPMTAGQSEQARQFAARQNARLQKPAGKVEEVTHGGKQYTQVTQPNGLIVLRPVKEGSTTATTPGAKPKAPTAGEVRNGYRFKGGDPSKQSSWEKV